MGGYSQKPNICCSHKFPLDSTTFASMFDGNVRARCTGNSPIYGPGAEKLPSNNKCGGYGGSEMYYPPYPYWQRPGNALPSWCQRPPSAGTPASTNKCGGYGDVDPYWEECRQRRERENALKAFRGNAHSSNRLE